MRLWDPDTGKEVHSFSEEKGYAAQLDWHPSGTCIGTSYLFDTSRRSDLIPLLRFEVDNTS